MKVRGFGSLLVLTMVATLIALLAPAGRGAADEFDSNCPRAREHSTPIGIVPVDKRPVVLVHGWGGNSDSMGPVERGVEALAPGQFAFRYFDYRRDNQRWADERGTSDCLAYYVHQVSTSYREAGGDGRVLLVAHSMGGLLARFAANQLTPSQPGVPRPILPSELAGVVTIDTPHAGSPFAGGAAAVLDFSSDLRQAFPDNGSRAGKCLAEHDANRRLPSGCALPPYFPAGTHLTQIAGEVTIDKQFLFWATPIPVGGDGVVTTASQIGYVGSGAYGAAAYDMPALGDATATYTLQCNVRSDDLYAGISRDGGILEAADRALVALVDTASDGLLQAIGPSGAAVEGKLVVLGAAASETAPCGHNAILQNPDAHGRIYQGLADMSREPTVDLDALWAEWRALNEICRGGPPEGEDPTVDQACTDRDAILLEHAYASATAFLEAWQRGDGERMSALTTFDTQVSLYRIPDDLLEMTLLEETFDCTETFIELNGRFACYISVVDAGQNRDVSVVWEVDFDRGWLVVGAAPDV